jgi:hypothetical protein
MLQRKLLHSCYFILSIILISPGAVLDAQEKSDQDIPSFNEILTLLDYENVRELYVLREHQAEAYPDDHWGTMSGPGMIGYTGMTPKRLVSHVLEVPVIHIQNEGTLHEQKYDFIYKKGSGNITARDRRNLVERIVQELKITLQSETVKTTSLIITASDDLNNYIITSGEVQSMTEIVSGSHIYFENVSMDKIVEKLSEELAPYGYRVINETGVEGPLTLRLNTESLDDFMLDAGQKGLMVDLKERPTQQYTLIPH